MCAPVGELSVYAVARGCWHPKALLRKIRLDLVLTITSHCLLRQGVTFYDGLLATCAKTTGAPTADIAASFNRLQLETGGTHLCQFFMRVSHGGGKVSVIDLSSERRLFGWYA